LRLSSQYGPQKMLLELVELRAENKPCCFATERVWRVGPGLLLARFGSHPRSDGWRRLQTSCGGAREQHRGVVLCGVSLLPSRQRRRTVGATTIGSY